MFDKSFVLTKPLQNSCLQLERQGLHSRHIDESNTSGWTICLCACSGVKRTLFKKYNEIEVEGIKKIFQII